MLRIAFEGADGSGKSTQVDLFYKWLRESNLDAALFHEPRPLRDKIFEKCKIPGIDDAYISYMFGQDGIMCRQEELKSQKPIIVRDRDTTISQYAYHHGFGTPDPMIWMMAWMLNNINGVDIIFFVHVPFEVGFERIKKRAGEKAIVDYFEKEEKLRRIYENYNRMFVTGKFMSDMTSFLPELMGYNNAKIVIIDGNKDVNNVSIEIQNKFRECFT